MRAASMSQYSSLAAAGGQPAEAEALNTWTAAASEAIVVMLSTSSADTSVRLIRLRSDFDALAAQAHAALDRLTPATVAALEPMERAMMQYSHRSPNIFNTRAAQLAAGSAVRGALLENKQLSAQFVASAASVFKSIQDDTHAQSDFFPASLRDIRGCSPSSRCCALPARPSSFSTSIAPSSSVCTI
jgi:hypothetical protein